ncbi:MAG: Ku protein [Chitinophagaceae bacterium]
MKAIWTGAIGFGLVNIPIKMYSAVQGSELDLDMLDSKDHANIKFQRVNANTGKVVAYENIVKGYKLDDKYVIVTDDDFKKASPEKTKTIDIHEFVQEKDIDSMYYETPYYLEPQKSGSKAYGLLRDALKKTGKVGLGAYVLRSKESLCLIKPDDDLLILQKIRFQDEIRKADDLKIPAAESKAPELKMAIALIEQLSGPFDISKYKDTYTDELMKLIMAKSKGKKLATPALRIVHSKTKDLMSQLKASLETKKKKAS